MAKKRPPKMEKEMMDTGEGHKGVVAGTIRAGKKGRHPSPESRKTTGLPHHSPGSDGGHKRMESRGKAPKAKRGKKRAGTK